MSWLSAKIERKENGGREITVWGDTYEVKDELKERGYKYRGGQWSRKVNNLESEEELRFFDEKGMQISVKAEGLGWNAYDYLGVMAYDWQYRRQLEEEYADGEGD